MTSNNSQRFDRYLSLAGVASLILLIGCGEPTKEVGTRPELSNVLLITLDTTRADHLGCYGHDQETSPVLDALAAEGVRFEMAQSTSALTPMSHASILTGLFPQRHGLRVFYGPTGNTLRDDLPTLASTLQDRGWSTAAFVSAYTASQHYGLDRGIETFDTGIEQALDEMDLTRQQQHEHFWHDGRRTNTQRRGDATTDAALEWLEQATQPFMLWVHYFDAHDPSLVPPREFLDPYGVTPGEGAKARIAVYDPEIRYMDLQIGRLLDRLREMEQYDSTLIVVLADHGQGLLQHDWMRHRLIYQEEIRIPLILHIPGETKGTVVTSLVRNVDVFPTILDYLGIAAPQGLDGASLRPLIQGETESEPRVGYAEALNTLDTHSPGSLPRRQKDLLFSIVEQDWKLIYHQEHPKNSELYHLATDPQELQNVIEQHPEEAKRLMAQLRASGGLEIEVIHREGGEDPEMIDRLRSLGYIQ
jgi:arylsulfatase A-like enzyme